MRDAIEQASYLSPHIVWELKLKNSSDLLLLQALFKLQDDYLHHWDWFFVLNSRLVEMTKTSESTVQRAKQRLKHKRLIDYRVGNYFQKRCTQYKMLINTFYSATTCMSDGQKVKC